LFEKNAAKASDRRVRGGTYELPSPEGDLIITHPLASQAVRLLGLSDGKLGVAETVSSKHPPAKHNAPSTELPQPIKRGTLIWHLCGKFVVRLDKNTVAKFAYAIAMEHIRSHAPDMLIPVPFGVASIGDFNYVFMSFVEGVSLDKLWPTLADPGRPFRTVRSSTTGHNNAPTSSSTAALWTRSWKRRTPSLHRYAPNPTYLFH
jgi:hypothetical protein